MARWTIIYDLLFIALRKKLILVLVQVNRKPIQKRLRLVPFF